MRSPVMEDRLCTHTPGKFAGAPLLALRRPAIEYGPESPATEALWSVPAAGGSAVEAIKCVKGGAIAVGASGIYYASCNFAYELNTELHVFDPDTKLDRLIGILADYSVGLEVSPDEKAILYNKAANRGLHKRLSVGADLKLIEHFR